MWWNKIQSCLNLKIGTDTSRLLLIVRPFLIMITKLLAGPRRWNPPFCQESLLGHSEVCPKGRISKLFSNFLAAKMAGYECFPRNQKIFLSSKPRAPIKATWRVSVMSKQGVAHHQFLHLNSSQSRPQWSRMCDILMLEAIILMEDLDRTLLSSGTFRPAVWHAFSYTMTL